MQPRAQSRKRTGEMTVYKLLMFLGHVNSGLSLDGGKAHQD